MTISWALIAIILGGGGLLVYEYVRGKLLRSGHLPKEEKKLLRSIASELRRKLSLCPACDGELDRHYVHEAMCVAEPTIDCIRDIDDAMKRHEWPAVMANREWDSGKDALCMWVLECPIKRSATVYRVESRAALSQDDRIDVVEVLSSDQAESLLSCLPTRKGIYL